MGRVKSINRPAHAIGFSGAKVFRVEADAGAFCLRVWPGRSSANRIAALHRFILAINDDAGGCLPTPVTNRDDDTLTRSCGRLWHVETWRPGAADFHNDPSTAKLRSAMRALARIHLAASRYVCPAEDVEWFGSATGAVPPAIVERGKKLDWWMDRIQSLLGLISQEPDPAWRELTREFAERFKRHAPRVRQSLMNAEQFRVDTHPCLRDVWHDHVLFEGEMVTGIIDAAAARRENMVTDLTRLLGSLIGDDRLSWKTAIAAYEELRPLTASERELIPLYTQSGVLLSGMTWLKRHYLDDRRVSNDLRVVARLTIWNGRLSDSSFIV